MKRVFSVLRRKPGFVDVLVPLVSGVDGYRIKAATNWDAASATVVTSGPYGYVDPELRDTVASTPDNRADAIRIVFKPSKYSLSDTGPLWLQLAYVIGGVEQNAASATPPSAITLVGPTSAPYNAMQVFTGNAPNGAAFANALQIDLPRQVDNLKVSNTDDTTGLYVAFQEEGPEVPVSAGKEISSIYGTISSLWVRGSGASVPIVVTFSYANPR